MPNMSYCRMENTYGDLQDCYEALMEKPIEELSETERYYACELIKLCEKISNEFLGETNI